MAIIEDIERRLLNWAEWQHGGLSGGLGYAACSLDAVRGGKGSPAVVQSGEPEETAQAIQSLQQDLRDVVRMWYLVGNIGVAEKARRLGCCVQTLYRRREAAHRGIQVHLSTLANERRYARERPVRL